MPRLGHKHILETDGFVVIHSLFHQTCSKEQHSHDGPHIRLVEGHALLPESIQFCLECDWGYLCQERHLRWRVAWLCLQRVEKRHDRARKSLFHPNKCCDIIMCHILQYSIYSVPQVKQFPPSVVLEHFEMVTFADECTMIEHI